MKVVILSTARGPAYLYGSTMVAKTLRVGFPTATVEWWDNASHHECVEPLKRCAYDVGASFFQLPQRTSHYAWIKSIFKREQKGPLVFCDPDCVFFGNMEEMELQAHLTGRLCPAYYDEVTECNECERLHTCLLFVKDPKALRELLDAVPSGELFPWDWVSPRKTARKGRIWFHDTMAMAYGAVGGKAITSEYLARFGHLVMGSWLSIGGPKMTEYKEMMALHRAATIDQNVLRDCWAVHDKYYANHKPI